MAETSHSDLVRKPVSPKRRAIANAPEDALSMADPAAVLRLANCPLSARMIGRLQATVGNAYVQRVIAQARAATLADVHTSALAARAQGNDVVLSGVPALKAAPGGLNSIRDKDEDGPAGWTGVPNAAAFTAPTIDIRNSSANAGGKWQHFAEIQPTSSDDVQLEAYYAGPGDHASSPPTTKIGKKTYSVFTRISPEVSDLIRQGEQEHIDDAHRAFVLTYGRVADETNALAKDKNRFGPADTPAAADKLAWDALFARLPAALSGGLAQWPKVLDTLLKATKLRDTAGWHNIARGLSKFEGNKNIHLLYKDAKTSIGKHPSSEVVNLPTS
jgi:hypothetical protein